MRKTTTEWEMVIMGCQYLSRVYAATIPPTKVTFTAADCAWFRAPIGGCK